MANIVLFVFINCVFDNSNFLEQVLGRSKDALVGKVLEAQSRLLPYKIARDGSLMEWVYH